MMLVHRPPPWKLRMLAPPIAWLLMVSVSMKNCPSSWPHPSCVVVAGYPITVESPARCSVMAGKVFLSGLATDELPLESCVGVVLLIGDPPEFPAPLHPATIAPI